MPSTKLPKALSLCDVIIRERKDALEGEGCRVILEGDAADSLLRSLITTEKEAVEGMVEKRQAYVDYQAARVNSKDLLVIPEILEAAASATLKQAHELRAIATAARKLRQPVLVSAK
jgi:hypothetical protein